MPRRANPLVPAVFARSLAAAVVLGLSWVASAAADGCVEKPNLEINQAGHWYYYVDRVHHRRCWFFETSRATISPPSDRVAAANADPQPSWFSRFTAGVTQTLSPEPQQNIPQQSSVLDNSSTVTTTILPRYSRTNKIARREPPQIVPTPATNGVASAERHDQSLPQPAVGKDEEHPPQLTTADRETLFQDFLKWYIDRNVFGRP
jgi:hypothetical protein